MEITSGEVHSERVSRLLFSTDASIYQLIPYAAVEPASADEVAALVRLAREENISLHPRGGATGLSGESLGSGIVLDMHRHFRGISEFDPQSRSVKVGCGVTPLQLNSLMQPHGLMYGPDPSSGTRAAFGGIIANNATGAHSLAYGYALDSLLELELVFSDGSRATVSADSLPDSGLGAQVPAMLADIHRRYSKHYNEYPQMERNRSGYNLRGVASKSGVNLLPLICGSEGTLAIVTAARLKLVEIPEFSQLVLIAFKDIHDACDAVAELMQHAPSAIELIDKRVIDMARRAGMSVAKEMPQDIGAVLYAEWSGHHDDAVQAAREATAFLEGRAEIRIAADEEEKAHLWRLRKEAEALILKQPGARHPISFVEDTAVPFAKLKEWFDIKKRVFKKHDYDWVTFGHAGSGVLHTKVFVDLRDKGELQGLENLAADLYGELMTLGGTISSEHADGFSRSAFIELQYPELYPAFKEIKKLFDPEGILNPGRKTDAPKEHPVAYATRYGGRQPRRMLRQELEVPEGLQKLADACHGCGGCRKTDAPTERPCPVYELTHSELDSPRARGNLMRLYVEQYINEDELFSDTAQRIANGCVNCKSCIQNCPSGVDIPALMLEYKAQLTKRSGLDPQKRLIARADILMGMASQFAPVVNLFTDFAPARLLAEKFGNIDSGLSLGSFAHGFEKKARQLRTSTHTKSIVFYPDYHILYQNHKLGLTFVKLMDRFGYNVEIHKGCSMLPSIGAGEIGRARAEIYKQLEALRPFVEKGIPVVCLEPSTALAMKQEWPMLCSDPVSEKLSGLVKEAGNFLYELLADNLPNIKIPVKSVFLHHLPCHLKALQEKKCMSDLLRINEVISILPLEDGCCGMAGTYGMLKSKSKRSLDLGARLAGRLKDENRPVITECSAFAMQIARMNDKLEVLHPVELLAKVLNTQIL